MKISNQIVTKFQEGGAMPAEQAQPQPGAPQEGAAPQEGQAQADPLMQLAEMAAQALDGQDCQLLAQVAEGFLSLIQSQGGGEQAPQEAPVYKKGGKLVRKTK